MLASEMIYKHMRLHDDYLKTHNALLTQLYMRKIKFNQFLCE